ncbi:MAG: ABC transporter permease [Planctomycetaceae bacterium]|nr:MAG: ABC transporter permease [Planctomycetaceae bacterium]
MTKRASIRFIGKNFSAFVGLAIMVLLIVTAILAWQLAPNSPTKIAPPDKLLPPSVTHPFGTDDLGRDILSRVIHGSRISLTSGLLVVAIAMTLGVGLGLAAGYWGGLIDGVVMRMSDVFLSFPRLVLAMVIATSLGPGLVNGMIAVALSWWPWYARLVRGQVLILKQADFVAAATAVGARHGRIIARHLFPNIIGLVAVQTSLDLGYAILFTASLSFIGLGAQPPTPEWGSMIAQGRNYMLTHWWYPTFPGLAIFLAVLGSNLFGDGLRDILDPRLRHAA